MMRAKPKPERSATPPDPGRADAAPAASEEAERGPLRRCIVTRESGPKEAMLRFVLGPDQVLVPDLAGKLPGRGMWLSARADVLERAVKRGAFAKAARTTVQLPPDLAARIVDGLRGRIRDLIGLARRSGQAVSGRDTVREWLRVGRAGLLVEASDGSPAERARLIGGREVPVVAPLPADMLGGVFGRDHAVHVAIAPGRLAAAIAQEAGRLAGLSGPASPAPSWTAPPRGQDRGQDRGKDQGPAGGAGRDDRRDGPMGR
jgi:uncharacterized protein